MNGSSSLRISWRSAACLLAGISILVITAGPGSANPESAKREYWQTKYATIIAQATSAEKKVEVTRVAYRESRQRDRPRGTERQQLVTDLETAEAEWAAASKRLAEFPEEAHRAGVPPGWLREVEEGKL